MEQAGPLTDAQRDFVERIQFAVGNMNELIQNMMSLAQADLNATTRHEDLNITGILREMAKEFETQAKEKEQLFNTIIPNEEIILEGDPLQIRQVFRNLIGNAIKYTPKGGEVKFKVETDEGKVNIMVADNGYGIPAADLPFIFNRFYRVRSGKASEVEGNGLGLAIVKTIVEQHNGHLSVESELGKGTLFGVRLPLKNK